MPRLKSLIIAGLITILPVLSLAQVQVFPRVDTADLNGRTISFPDQLPHDPTLVLVAFKRQHQDNLDAWIKAMNLKTTGAPVWIEMPVIANYGALWRGFIDNGMRSGITNKDDRAKVFTVYVNPDRFRSFFDMPTDEDIYLMVVAQNGQVLATVQGDYSPEKETVLRAALK